MSRTASAPATHRRVPRRTAAGLVAAAAAVAAAVAAAIVAPLLGRTGAVSVFDDRHPAVANLDPDLLRALRAAATAAAADGIEIRVNSGWRSPEYQTQLFHEAVAEYGSTQEAARWVATAQTSAHVSGEAVDIGPADATAWLAERGAGYGLCRIYRNEPWHFELRPAAADHGCPPPYADPTQDPRMRQPIRATAP